MAETEQNPPENQPEANAPPPAGARADDVVRVESWDRWSSRVLFIAGIFALAIGFLTAADHKLPRAYLLAWLATFMATKIGLAILGLRAGWRAWPALGLETLALGLVGFVVRSYPAANVNDPKSLAMIVLAMALLGGAGLLRRRAAN